MRRHRRSASAIATRIVERCGPLDTQMPRQIHPNKFTKVLGRCCRIVTAKHRGNVKNDVKGCDE